MQFLNTLLYSAGTGVSCAWTCRGCPQSKWWCLMQRMATRGNRGNHLVVLCQNCSSSAGRSTTTDKRGYSRTPAEGVQRPCGACVVKWASFINRIFEKLGFSFETWIIYWGDRRVRLKKSLHFKKCSVDLLIQIKIFYRFIPYRLTVTMKLMLVAHAPSTSIVRLFAAPTGANYEDFGSEYSER